jgi:hypothetical protein
MRAKLGMILLCAMALVLLVSACGSGSSSTSGSSDPSAPSAEFTGKGGENKPASFGGIADGGEREAASRVLERSLKARAAGDWAAQCATLNASMIAKIEAEGKKLDAGKGCAKSLRAEAEPLAKTKAIRANTLTGPIDVLRVEGIKGYALYHGTKGKDYAMPMEKNGGEWKVAALVTTEVP